MLAAKLYKVESHPWEYKAILDQDRSDIKIEIQVISLVKISTAVTQVKVELDDSEKDDKQ